MTIDVTQKKEGERRTEKEKRTPQKLEVRTNDESNRDGGTDSPERRQFRGLKARRHSSSYFDGGMSVRLSHCD